MIPGRKKVLRWKCAAAHRDVGMEPTHLEGLLWRAANGRLWLHLERDPLDGRVDELDVVRTLEKSVRAVFNRLRMVVEPLQEDWILPFTASDVTLTLDRDFWSGLTILS